MQESEGSTAMAGAAAGRPQPKKLSLREITMTVLIPAGIMTLLSSESRLGPQWALVLALLFPLSHGLMVLLRDRKLDWLAAVGIVSILLTGGLALLEVPADWIIVKETSVPLLIGLVLAGLQARGVMPVRWVLAQLLDLQRLAEAYDRAGRSAAEMARDLSRFEVGYIGTFFLSAVLNFLLARALLVSQPGTEAFTAELGRMTALSFPVISLPIMVVSFGLMLWLFRRVGRQTGQQMDAFLHGVAGPGGVPLDDAEALASDARDGLSDSADSGSPSERKS